MPKPSKEQLLKINQHSFKELSEDDVVVFRPRMIDDTETAYSSRLRPALLSKFKEDAVKGVALLLNHNKRQLPVGRVFDGSLVSEFESGSEINSLYGDFYIDKGRNTESGMSTDDIIKGIDSGAIFDVSVGFNAKSWECSICGHDIRDFMNCSHYPGEIYEVKGEDGVIREEKCIVDVGEDGKGELLELSLVYAGAADRATIKADLLNCNVTEFGEGSKLTLVGDFKNIPLSSSIYQYYTKDGPVLFTNSSNSTGGAEYLRKRSESKVKFSEFQEKVKDALGIEVSDEDSFVESIITKFSNISNELEGKSNELETVREELSLKEEKVREITEELSASKEKITSLEADVTEKTEFINSHREELIEDTLSMGVKAQGNAFNSGLFGKFLSTLSIDEIKEVKEGFSNEVKDRFARVTSPEDKGSNDGDLGAPSKDDEDFRSFIVEKAQEYVKENPDVKIKDALSLMNRKYSKED